MESHSGSVAKWTFCPCRHGRGRLLGVGGAARRDLDMRIVTVGIYYPDILGPSLARRSFRSLQRRFDERENVWRLTCVSDHTARKRLQLPMSSPRQERVPIFAGASLPSYTKLAQRKGYRLVATNTLGFNAFFVRSTRMLATSYESIVQFRSGLKSVSCTRRSWRASGIVYPWRKTYRGSTYSTQAHTARFAAARRSSMSCVWSDSIMPARSPSMKRSRL